MTEDEVAEVQMAMVKVARNCRTASCVWSELFRLFPEFEKHQIREACRPLIVKMVADL